MQVEEPEESSEDESEEEAEPEEEKGSEGEESGSEDESGEEEAAGAKSDDYEVWPPTTTNLRETRAWAGVVACAFVSSWTATLPLSPEENRWQKKSSAQTHLSAGCPTTVR